MADEETLGVYARKAQDYADRFASREPGTHLSAFMRLLPPAARVLDLGCGPGNAAAAMIAAGHMVEAWDASPDMARVAAERFGIEVRVATFDMLDAEAAYDAVYANFSLLHLPKREMPATIARIARALKPGGLLHVGLKTGTGERRDTLGRFYAFYEEGEIIGLLEEAGFAVTSRATGQEAGLDGTVSPWIILQARTHG
jgi:trans-aconitate methyltransferase